MRPAALAAGPLVPTVDSQRSLAPRHEASTGTKLSQHADPSGPPGTKLSPHTQKRRFRPTFRTQGESFHAHANNKPRRENFVPHARPVPVQNSPSTRTRRARPVQHSPGTPEIPLFDAFCASRESFIPLPPPPSRSGRKKSRTNTPPTRPSPQFRMQFHNTSDATSRTDTHQHDARGELHANFGTPSRSAAFATPACRQEHTRPQHRNKTRPTTRLLGLTAKKFAQHSPSNGTSAKKFAQHAKKR